MNRKEFIQLVEKYNDHRCSPGEKEILEKYLDSYQKGNEDWLESDMGDREKTEDIIFRKILNKINNNNITWYQKIIPSSYVGKIAASLLICLLMGYAVFRLTHIHQDVTESPKWSEISTNIGEKRIITLLDGTKITLNADSKLKFMEVPSQKKRDVYLSGEAYFEVAHDTAKPFSVYSGNLTTTVLGTKFDVKDFPNERDIIVSLVEGKVKIFTGSNEGKILFPNQQIAMNKVSGVQKLTTFKKLQATGWKDNVLVFDNTTLDLAFLQLERAYGVRFELSDHSYKNLKIKANFQNESLWTIIKVIESATGLKHKSVYEKEHVQKIVF